jgi:hypothetical protein
MIISKINNKNKHVILETGSVSILCEREDEITQRVPLVQRMRQACAHFSPEEESPSISKMLFFIPDFRRRAKAINPLTPSVTNEVLFNVALSTAERPVPAKAIHLFSTHSAESKEIPTSVSTKIEKNEIGGAYSSDGGGERLVQGFGRET